MVPRREVWVSWSASALLIANMGDMSRILWIFFCSLSRNTNNSSFRCTTDEQIDHSHQTPQLRKSTREDNKLALYYYFRSNSAKRGYRKRMIEACIEFGRFKSTNQRPTEQIIIITRNGWFSDLEINEFLQQIYKQAHQQISTTVTGTINTGRPLYNNDTCTPNTNANTDLRGKTLM